MSKLLSAKKLVAKFRTCTSGSIVPIAAVSIMAITFSAGLAVDYSRISQNKTIISGAVDTAVLQAAKRMALGEHDAVELEKTFKDFFLANLEGRGISANEIEIGKFKIDPALGDVEVEITSKMKTSFMALAGYKTVDFPVSASATYGAGKIEVSFVLDVTGSMGDYLNLGVPLTPAEQLKYQNNRIGALKIAAINAVNKLVSDLPGGSTRVAIVPYSNAINAGTKKVVAGGKASSSGCVIGRVDKEYSAEKFSNYPLTEVAANWCPSAEVLPLSDDKSKIVSAIDALSPAGGTAGHLGIAWGHYTLSDNVGIWSYDEKPLPANGNLAKVAILMTDGKFNSYYSRTVGNMAAESNNASKKMCEEMRKNGITIYSVVLGADNPSSPLSNCASTDKDGKKLFFKVNSAKDLIGTFDAIATKVGDLRLSS